MAAFGWTHDQYMDTPAEATAWLLHIHQAMRKYEAERQEKANRDG